MASVGSDCHLDCVGIDASVAARKCGKPRTLLRAARGVNVDEVPGSRFSGSTLCQGRTFLHLGGIAAEQRFMRVEA